MLASEKTHRGGSVKINFPSLFKTPLNHYKFFFIYGNDLSVFDRIIFFLNQKLSFSLQIKSEKELLTNSCSQQSLFEDTQNKFLNLTLNVSDKILNHIDQMGEGIFIFTSEKARAQSKLVTHFSSSPLSLAIAAYASPLTTSEFDFLASDLNLPAPFQGLLFKTYQNDYMGLLATLEKIKLYGDVPDSAYTAFLESPSSEDIQSSNHPFLLRNVKKVSEILLTVNASDMIPFLRSLLRSFQTLYELMPFKQKPDSIVWQKLQTPVFFKDQPLYQAALLRWRIDEISLFLESLLKLECKIKYERITLSQVSQELLQIVK